MPTYSKLTVDGLCVKVWKGPASKCVIGKSKMAGIIIELSNKEEYLRFKKTKKKRNTKKPEQLSLFSI